MRHSGTFLMALGGLMVLFYPCLWVYGKVSQVYLHRQWETSTAIAAANNTGKDPAVGRLVIPSLLVDQIVVQGVGESQLAQGPGHFPNTALPGHGNCAIIGHLNVNGSPFRDLARLAPGDPVLIQTADSVVEYKVSRTAIVHPSDLDLLKQDGPRRLTLITCMPGAKMRYAVVCRQTKID